MRFLIIWSLLPIFSLPTLGTETSQPREVILFDSDWRFEKGDPSDLTKEFTYDQLKPWLLPASNSFRLDPAAKVARPTGNLGGDLSFVQPIFDDSTWRPISLPHDWAIEGPFDKKASPDEGKRDFWGPVWYRKHFELPATDRGRMISLAFDGAMSYATVWVNGQCAGGWPYGYASFQLDITPYCRAGADNVVAVRLDSPLESSRWYPGAGLYRNVWLIKTASVHVAQWGVTVTTPRVSSDSASVEVKSQIENEGSQATQAETQIALYAQDATGAVEAQPVATSEWTPTTIAAGAIISLKAAFTLTQPRLWDLKTPNLYTAVTSVREAGAILDRQESTFGVRSIKFDPDAGFLLNGRHVPIQGVCLHSDLGALGTAVNRRGLQRQIEILQEMGCNAIRTSHNPPSPELIDLCNRMGMLVMAESFDCWGWGKKDHDYHLLFNDWSEADLRALIRHYRNDPSVIMWSIGNELSELGHPEAQPIAQRLTEIVHEEDPTRPSTVACHQAVDGFSGFQHCVDVFGFNYKPTSYAKFRAADGNQSIPLFGSETTSTVSLA
jgi:beta-galactosidase